MKVVIVDDDRVVSMSLKTILESKGVEVLATGASGREAIELYEIHSPDVMLMDIRMDAMDGIEAGTVLLEKYPDAKILYLTTFTDDEYIIKALNIGAKGYILKQDYEGIVSALTAVMEGQTVFGEAVSAKLNTLVGSREEFDYEEHDITDKERSIIELVAMGLSNKEIAKELHLSDGTVRNYISSVLDKLGLRDRTQIAVFYYTSTAVSK